MPIITTLRTPVVPQRLRACQTCSQISPAVRLANSPSVPVSQKVHPIAHPTCDDTHTVFRNTFPSFSTSPPSLAARGAPAPPLLSSPSLERECPMTTVSMSFPSCSFTTILAPLPSSVVFVSTTSLVHTVKFSLSSFMSRAETSGVCSNVDCPRRKSSR